MSSRKREQWARLPEGLTDDEAAERCGVKASTIRRWRRDRRKQEAEERERTAAERVQAVSALEYKARKLLDIRADLRTARMRGWSTAIGTLHRLEVQLRDEIEAMGEPDDDGAELPDIPTTVSAVLGWPREYRCAVLAALRRDLEPAEVDGPGQVIELTR